MEQKQKTALWKQKEQKQTNEVCCQTNKDYKPTLTSFGTRQPDKHINQAGVPQSQADSDNPSQSLCSTLPSPGIAPNKEALPL